VIAPGGVSFYTASLFPDWRGDLFIGGLQSGGLVRLVLDGERVRYEERLFLGTRVRDVQTGPDGALYVATDDGRILRLAPS
jgi:glucose/arabinose dehydrogenase